jgi:transcriptional regulator with XRE-family HTH domain
MKTSIGAKLRSLRLERNMTMKDVALALQISRSTYRDWEYGRKVPAKALAKIAEVFKVSLNDLLEQGAFDVQLFPRAISLIEEALSILRSARWRTPDIEVYETAFLSHGETGRCIEPTNTNDLTRSQK